MPATFTIVGLAELPAKMKRLENGIRNKRAMFKKISVMLDQWAMKNFQGGGKLAHPGGWVPLKASTIRRRRKGKGKRKRGVKILQDTGRGRASVRTRTTSRSSMIFTDLDYMVAHHKGKGRLPVRRVIPLKGDRKVEAAALKIAQHHLKEAIRKSGL